MDDVTRTRPGGHDVQEAPTRLVLPERYQDLGRVGLGSFGEVRRVFDAKLERSVAMKILRDVDAVDLDGLEEEAKLTAKLEEHPAIVGVYDLGVLEDGRPWYTMRLVNGETMEQVLARTHDASGLATSDWPQNSWSLPDLVRAMEQICRAVAFAHAIEIPHRDICPRNIMVNGHGGAYLLDWGLAHPGTQQALGGTPHYSAPEWGGGGDVDLRLADVYSLGATLYHVLCGRPPWLGNRAQIRAAIRSGLTHAPLSDAIQTSAKRMEFSLHKGLVDLCEKALDPSPSARLSSASAMADALTTWLAQEQRREEVKIPVVRAGALLQQAEEKRVSAAQLRFEARDALVRLKSYEPSSRRHEAWQMEDLADARMREVHALELSAEAELNGVLRLIPDHAEASAVLANHHFRQLEEAERRGERRETERLERLVRRYDRDGRHDRYLSGLGAVHLRTDPPDADIQLFCYRSIHRRLEPMSIPERHIQEGEEALLPLGSYLALISAEGHHEVRYPFVVSRSEPWSLRPPGAEPQPIRLPRLCELEEGDCFVPAGWFWAGGDEFAMDSAPARRIWIDDCIVRRDPVTVAEFIEFLNDLVETGREEDAVEFQPTRAVSEGAAVRILRRAGGGVFTLAHPEGMTWQPSCPVAFVTWTAAMAYTQWFADRVQRPWRLPHDLEWEKAARGVDARAFPWGNFLDHSWTCIYGSQPMSPPPSTFPVESLTLDVSPYEVRGLAGNVRDWCINAYQDDAQIMSGERLTAPQVTAGWHKDLVHSEVKYICRGGLWTGEERTTRLAARVAGRPDRRLASLGFRLARGLGSSGAP